MTYPISSRCHLCGSSELRTWHERDAKKGTLLAMGMCSKCSFVQQLSVPNDDELKIYYSHNYREDYKSVHSPKPKYVYRAGLAARDRIARLKAAGITATTHPRLLDIGAGGGEFCYVAQRHGFDARGLEPHLGYSEFAREQYGVKVQTGEIQGLDATNPPDLITLFHVLEHLANPPAVFEKLWSIGAPGSALAIEVPNIHQADASPHNIYFQAHLFYYSRHTLVAAASRYYEPKWVDDEGNLTIVFHRRDTPLETSVLPSEKECALTRQRLREKGWLEYLIKGGALRKPFRRLERSRAERGVEQLSPRQILDAVVQK